VPPHSTVVASPARLLRRSHGKIESADLDYQI